MRLFCDFRIVSHFLVRVRGLSNAQRSYAHLRITFRAVCPVSRAYLIRSMLDNDKKREEHQPSTLALLYTRTPVLAALAIEFLLFSDFGIWFCS